MTKLRKRVSAVTLSAALAAMAAGCVAGFVPRFADAEAAELAPIAKYEFKDETNFGKDSMGNYDMSYRNAWMEGGTGPLLDKGTMIEGGGVEFNGEFCVAQDQNNNIFSDVTAFTLAFELKTSAAAGAWTHYIGVGNGAHDFAVVSRGGGTELAGLGAVNTENTQLGTIWGTAILNTTDDAFTKIIISAQPGGQLRTWVNGTEFIDTTESKMPADLPDDWSPLDQNCTFSIGANFNGAAAYPAVGAIKNVVFYDFAMDGTGAAAYNANGKVTADDVKDMTTITGLSVTDESFGENDPTKVTLYAGMSAEDMLAQMNEANATVTLSDGSTATAPVTWTSITQTDGTYYANGTVDTVKVGYANVYGSTVSFALDVAKIENISEPQFEGEVTKGELLDSMTEEEMLALINTATVTVTLPGGATEEVTVTFTRIEGNMGVYTACADVLLNGAAVGTVLVPIAVTETNEGDMQELLPVAKYEFEDASDPGKDSMGNYDLGPVAIESGDLSNAYGTGTITDGVLYLSGNDMLACAAMNDVGDNLDNGFTLNFQYRQDGDLNDPQGWNTPISFGYNDWNPTKRLTFQVANGAYDLRIGAHGGVADDGAGNTFWGPTVLADGRDKMHNITVSVRPGETLNVYVDGALAYTHECPADWNVTDSNMAFAVGGVCVWSNGYNRFKGWIDNVSIYNFAVSLEQSNAYWEKGKLTVGDMDGEIITSIASTPKFENDEVTNGNLTDRLSNTQAVRRVNPATVDAVFENEETIALNVTWQGLEQDSDGKWYIVGVVDPSNIGYATLLTTAQEVRQEVSVERVARAVSVASGVKNGSVTADKEEAYLGDTVTFTVTPDEGYKVDSVTVNGEALTANVDGTYTYTVEGIEDVEVSATFTASSTGEGEGEGGEGGESGADVGCNGGCSGGLSSSLGIGSAVVIAAAAAAAILFLRRKKYGKHE